MSNIVDTILDDYCLNSLKEGEMFLSEDDFKFSFAKAAEKCGATNVILEYPIMTSDLYKKKECVKESYIRYFKENPGNANQTPEKRFENNRSFIDVYFEYGNEKHFVELKYKTLEQDVIRHGKVFTLRDQGAQDNGMYDIHEDIERMEAIMSIEECNKGHVVFITNDLSYLSEHNGTKNGPVSLFGNTHNGKIVYSGRRNLEIENMYKTWTVDNASIFEIKNDPSFHKLIIHINDEESIFVTPNT